MSRALTIEEIKDINDYIYVVNLRNKRDNGYRHTKPIKNSDLFFTYGKTWLAYRNKEEFKGRYDEIEKQVAKEILESLTDSINNIIFDERISDKHSSIMLWHLQKFKDKIKKEYGVK